MTHHAHVTAVLSLFNPPPDLPDRVVRMLEQVDAAVAVDDGSTNADTPAIHSQLRALGVTVLRGGSNQGIAAALNRGIVRARAMAPDTWILTMDQDSALGERYVQKAQEAYASASADGVRAGAVTMESLGDAPSPDEGSECGHSLAYDPIQSGLLIAPQTIATVGLLRAELFIDSVDSEYTLRMRRHGLVVVRAPGTVLEHRMGTPRPMLILGRQVIFQGRPANVPFQSPFRIYYITRNLLYITRWYFGSDAGWLARKWRAESVHGAARLLWGPRRRAIVVAAAYGFAAFVGGLRGPMSASLSTRLRRC